MAQSSDRSKISVRPASSRPTTKSALCSQLSALSISTLEEKLSLFSSSCSNRSGRNSQPASPSQILRQALRSGVNSPKATEAYEQENKPPGAFSFSGSKTGKSASRGTGQQSPSAILLPHSSPKSSNPRSGSQSALSHSSLSSVVTQQRSADSQPRSSDRQYKEHLFNTFQAIKFVRRVKDADAKQLNAKTVFLPRENYGRKTVVFDLDETLVHCVEDISQAHIAIPITFPSGERIIAGVNIRPYAKECLATVSAFCEVIVFTASQKCYADQVLDYLDPTRSIISLRLYRESCVVTDGVFIKDLRILANRRLQDIIIIDNAAYSFAYQLSNGVPIISWYDDPSDRELFNLVDYLRGLSLLEDVRPANRDTFHLDTFCEDYEKDCLK